MSRGKPVVVKLHEVQAEQLTDCFAMLAERTKGVTRDGKPYYTCRFRDARRTATWMVWADSDRFAECENDWQPGMFFKLRVNYDEHPQYGPRIEVHNIRHVNDADRESGFNEADFVDRSRFDSTTMLTDIRGIVEASLSDEPLRKLVLLILERHAETLKKLPATPRHYFPFPGGWLEHTLSVLKNCLWLTEKYQQHYTELQPTLNLNLIIAGAVLHEIGRVVELQLGEVPGEPPEQTIPGRLFGHLSLGRDLVREAAREIPELNPELLQLLEHLLMSYLTLPEWGSPRLPMIPEAILLHHADDLDAKMEMYVRCLRNDTAEGPFTVRDPILGKQLLKQRTV